MQLLFDQTRVPRTLSRAEWRVIYRNVRMTRRELAIESDRMVERLRKLPATSPEAVLIDRMRGEMIQRLVNPPLLLGPYQDDGPISLAQANERNAAAIRRFGAAPLP